MKEGNFLKRRPVLVASLLIALLAFAAYDEFGHLQKEHMGRVFLEMGAATDHSKEGSVIQRAELYLAQIKTIDLGWAPQEFKHAMHGYITAFEESLTAFKAGQETGEIDARCADSKQRMVDRYRK